MACEALDCIFLGPAAARSAVRPFKFGKIAKLPFCLIFDRVEEADRGSFQIQKAAGLTCQKKIKNIMVAIVVIIFVFFIILSLMYLLGWLYNPDNNILGGAILMLLTFIILLVLFLISVHNRQQKNKTGMKFPDHPTASAQIILS